MKNLLLLLLSITLFSCDTSSEPEIKVNDQFIFSNSEERVDIKYYDYLDTYKSRNAKYLISGNYVYLKGQDEMYYRALIKNNTDFMSITAGAFIFSVIVSAFVGFIFGGIIQSEY